MAYWGKANSILLIWKNLNEAVKKYDEAIGIWYECLKREETQILPNLFTVFYLKTDVLINSELWKLTAENISEAFRLREKAFNEYEISQHFKDQIQKWWDDIIQLVRNLPLKNAKRFTNTRAKRAKLSGKWSKTAEMNKRIFYQAEMLLCKR